MKTCLRKGIVENGSGCLGPIFISLPTSLHMQKFGEFVKSNANSSCELCSSGIRAVSCFSPETLGYRA